MSRTVRLAFLALAALPLTLAAQRPSSRTTRDVPAGPPSTFGGFDLMYAAPQGQFKNYVNGAFGIGGHLLHQLDDDGIIAVRADLGFLIYGNRTARQPLGGGALGLINVDVTTSNNIVNGGLGLQLMAPGTTVRPYVNAGVGFSYFFTESSVEGSGTQYQPFASSQNFSDGGFSPSYGGGLYIPLSVAGSRVSLDIGAVMQRNEDVQYLTKNSITFTTTNAPPTITSVRSAADFVTFRLGVTFGIR
jgi:hypothetical protein